MKFPKTNIMNVFENGSITYLNFKIIDDLDFVKQAVSTRWDGVSSINGLESLNLGSHTADSIENVRENYKRFCTAAGFDADKVVLGKQTHSANVRYVTEADLGKGVFRERDYTDVDALITDKKNIPLVIHTADCVPVCIIDTAKKVIGAAHCGRRGTYARLAQKCINEMKTEFSSRAEDMVCTVGPCICKNCYEVSEDLYDKFVEEFSASDATEKRDGKFFLDLAAINRQILIESGVKPHNISVSDLCTCCNTEWFFSHRGQGPQRGIFATFLEIV